MTRTTTIFGWLLAGVLATGLAGGDGAGDDCYYCPQDLNSDSMIDVHDMTIVLEHWGCVDGRTVVDDHMPGLVIQAGRPVARCAGDCDEDGDVDVMDLVEVIMAWGICGE